jgi:hypothetical protein
VERLAGILFIYVSAAVACSVGNNQLVNKI